MRFQQVHARFLKILSELYLQTTQTKCYLLFGHACICLSRDLGFQMLFKAVLDVPDMLIPLMLFMLVLVHKMRPKCFKSNQISWLRERKREQKVFPASVKNCNEVIFSLSCVKQFFLKFYSSLNFYIIFDEY